MSNVALKRLLINKIAHINVYIKWYFRFCFLIDFVK